MAISVVINTYNAEKFLREVLDTVKSFDEIVICDMESKDGTLDIAREYGCKIVTFEKKNYVSAEPARTFAIQSASSEWVLVVDADELVTKELRDYLYKHIEDTNCAAGLYIPRKNYMIDYFMKSSYPDYQLRFFRREGTVWPPHVHTFPQVQGRVDKIPMNREDLAFIHLADTAYNTINKMNQYSENEIVKRKGVHVTMAKMIFSPFFRFFKTYILKGSIRYGKVGFIQACNNAYYKYVVLYKALERERMEKMIQK